MKIIVIKHAVPPMTFETGSAIKTPSTPNQYGRIIVNGITINTFLSSEKIIACFVFPSPVNTYCPVNCNAINTKPKKYICSGRTPASITFASPLNIPRNCLANNMTAIHITPV